MDSLFSHEIENLLNPLPKFGDPEDDSHEATKARVIEQFSEDEGVGVSGLRKKHSTSLLSDTDRLYMGRPVSRRQLLTNTEESADDDKEEDEDGDWHEEEEENTMEDEEADRRNYENYLEEDFFGKYSKLRPETKGPCSTFPHRVDFQKHVMMDHQGMYDVGVREEDSEMSDKSGSSGEDAGSDDHKADDGEGEPTVCTFSQDKVDEEVEKGKAVKNQLALWDQLLQGRIKIQKALVLANQIPLPQTFPVFNRMGGAELTGALKNTHKALNALQMSLLELHNQLLYQNPNTMAIAEGSVQGQTRDDVVDDNEEEDRRSQDAVAPNPELVIAEYRVLMASRFAVFEPYRNTILQKWHDKTRLTIGKNSKGFGAFERSILTQLEQVLMDNERLLRRTQTRRSEYVILGKKDASSAFSEGKVEWQQLKANAHLKDLDEDIFDDDDFYHQLLRELIERKTNATNSNDQVAMGRQWLVIQKLRRKIKKKVDTKASKGRKVRFHIHSKLVNFMAPVDNGSMSEEACYELYRSLFGQNIIAE